MTAYGQLQGASPESLTAGDDRIKMVLRMTGSGSLKASVIAPDGTTRDLDWGPEPHTASNFDRPGDEWGTGFSFDHAGCWQVAFLRGGSDAAVFWFDVAPTPRSVDGG